MKKSLLSALFAVVLFPVSNAHAGPFVSEGPGPTGTYASCEGQLQDGTAVLFEVRATAAVGFIDAVLFERGTNRLIDQLSCARGNAPRVPSAPRTLWNCTEYKPSPRFGISVEIQSGGVVGRPVGQIRQAQMFPLQPAVIGSLFCK